MCLGASNLAETVHNGCILEICMCLGASNLAEWEKSINLPARVLCFITLVVLYCIPERPVMYKIKKCGKMSEVL